MPRVVAVMGGKGGVGKTFIALNTARILGEEGRTLLIDADVDNPCATHFLRTELVWRESVESFVPVIDRSRCIECLNCVNHCPEKALFHVPSKGVNLIPDLCNGCGVCKIVCPVNAVGEGRKVEGWIEFYKGTALDLLVGKLEVGSRREAFVIEKLISRASRMWSDYSYVVIDSPPGTSAKLYPIARFSDSIALVTEPTPLGLSDLVKAMNLVEKVRGGSRVVIVVNKSGLNREVEQRILEIARSRGLRVFTIPYRDTVPRSVAGKRIYVDTFNDDISQTLRELARELCKP